MKKGELRCCLGCGRDCYGMYCAQCSGVNRFKKTSPQTSADETIHEDRYDEESGPDDTWDAQPPMFGKSEKGR